jgi:hypothetical protein
VAELREALVAPAGAAAPDLAVERGEELRSALRGIGDLPDRQRAALMAVAVEDRPHADVAAELGLSDGGLRQLLLRARTALRAAATAITPYPLVSWLSAGSDVGAARVAEVAAGAGGIGVAVKAGAAVLAAGAVVAGTPALRDEHAPTVRTKLTSPAARTVTTADDHVGRGEAEPADDRGGAAHSGKGSGGDDRSGSRGRGSGDDHSRSGSSGSESGDDRSGPSGSGDDGSGSSGSGGDDQSGSSGSGSSGSGPSGADAPSAEREGGDDRIGSSGSASSGSGDGERGESGSDD